MANHTEHTDYIGHIIPAKNYVVIWAILMVGTALTVFAATLELGVFRIVLALLIATIKGTLVVVFFMRLALRHGADHGHCYRLHLLALYPVRAHYDRLHLARLVHQPEPLNLFREKTAPLRRGRFSWALLSRPTIFP